MGWVRRRCLVLRNVNVYLLWYGVTWSSQFLLLGDVPQNKYIFAFEEAELFIMVIFVSCKKMLQEEILGQHEEDSLQQAVGEIQPLHHDAQAELCREK